MVNVNEETQNDSYLSIRTIIEFIKSYDILEDTMARHFARFGLSQPKFNALMQLRQAGENGLALSELGERMLVSRANITGLVDRMEKYGLVIRDSDPRDRRVFRAKLTEKAKNLLESVLPIHVSFTQEITSGLTPDEKAQFIALLHKFGESMEKV